MRLFKFILTLGIIFLSCKREKPGIKLLPCEWKDGEIRTYSVIVKGDTIGKTTYKIKYVKEGYEIDVLTEIESKGQKTSDHSIVTVEKNTLRPLKEERKISVGDLVYEVKAIYTQKNSKIKIKTPMGEKETQIELSENSFDNETITMVLRNIPFKTGYKAKIYSIVPLSATSVPIEINVMENEIIKVPAGEFESRKINLKFAGREINIWYNEKSPREMIKYEDTQQGITMVLGGN